MGAGRRLPERGAVGGIEVLPLALLVTIGGTLLVAHAWAVVDAKVAVEAAARAGGRAFVAETDPRTARTEGLLAARGSYEGSGRDATALEVAQHLEAYRRCSAVTHEVTTAVPSPRVPFVGSLGPPLRVTGRYRTEIARYASDLPGEADCAA